MKFTLLAFAAMTASVMVSADVLLPTPPVLARPQTVALGAAIEPRPAFAPLSMDRLPVPRIAGARGAARPSPGSVEVAPVEVTPVKPETLARAAAQAAIEADGYKGVFGLVRTAGAWRALALRGDAVVAVKVDDGGSVSAD